MRPLPDHLRRPVETDEFGIWEHRERNARIFAACFALGCIAVAVAVIVGGMK
jgi:hypothetical protein